MIEWTELAPAFDESNEKEVIEFIQRQRWFGGKGRVVVGAGLVDRVVIDDASRLVIGVVEIRFGGGMSDFYQLIFELMSIDESNDHAVITTAGSIKICDASLNAEMAQLVIDARRDDGVTRKGTRGEARFQRIRDIGPRATSVRMLDSEQSNTSLIVDERLIFKIYRRLDSGINPELELLLYLTEHDFPNVPRLTGWCSYSGADLHSTLALAQLFIPDAIDGWYLGLDRLVSAPEEFLEHLGRLGQVIGEMHEILAADSNDEDFAPEELTDETVALLGATLEEQISALSEVIPAERADALRSLVRTLTQSRAAGRLIRTHGDLHLGQVLWTTNDWVVIDFEGEPSRSLAERRQKRHPLRDIAGLLRSIAYLVAAASTERNVNVHASWEGEARDRVLGAYRQQLASSGLLPAVQEQDRLIRIFELEKILYEINYEMNHRPDWVAVPLAGIGQMLGEPL